MKKMWTAKFKYIYRMQHSFVSVVSQRISWCLDERYRNEHQCRTMGLRSFENDCTLSTGGNWRQQYKTRVDKDKTVACVALGAITRKSCKFSERYVHNPHSYVPWMCARVIQGRARYEWKTRKTFNNTSIRKYVYTTFAMRRLVNFCCFSCAHREHFWIIGNVTWCLCHSWVSYI